jgi:hypothetical protein
MKIRFGFVSNSSSTSFVVAIPEYVSKDDEPYIKLFEKIVDKLKAEDSDFGYGFVLPKDLIDDYDQKISDIKKELGQYEHFYNQIATYMADKKAQSAVQLYLDIVEKSRGIDYLKHHVPKKHLSELQNDTQKFIKDLNEELSIFEKEREQVILNSKDAKYIMTFKVDNWKSDIETALVTMIDHGIVKLVRREDS